MGAGQSIFLASNPTVFQQQYGIIAFGQYTRNLSNSSQKLVLADGFGNIIDTVQYFDTTPWPNADGNGSYLQLIDTSLDNNIASSWIASSSTTLTSKDFAISTNSKISPNPVVDGLNITATGKIEAVLIYDVYGKLLQSFTGISKDMLIPFSTYSTGMYFVKVYSQGSVRTEKIIKE
jgi:hypothetical protein